MIRMVMVVSLILCALFQALLPAWMGMGQAKAPLLLGAVLYYALTRDDTVVVESAIVAGLLQDSLGLIPLGFSSVAFVVVALLANHYRDRVFYDSWVTHVLIGMLASVVVTFILYVLLASGGHRVLGLGYVLSKSFGGAVLGIIAIPVVFKVVEWMDVKLGNVELKEI